MSRDDSPLKGFRPVGGQPKQEPKPTPSMSSSSSQGAPQRAANIFSKSSNIYCSQCGSPNAPSAKFCSDCGQALVQQPTPAYTPHSQSVRTTSKSPTLPASGFDFPTLWSNLTRGFKLSSSAGAALILFFFFPWVSASCGGMSVELSGSQIATGYSMQGFGVLEGNPFLYALILVGAAAIYLAYRHATERKDTTLASSGLFGLAGIGAIALYLVYANITGQVNSAGSMGQDLFGDLFGEFASVFADQFGPRVSYGIGLIGTIAALIAIAIGGELNRRDL